MRKVAVIGAGVAGLQTAKALREIGLDVTIFEKSENVGGVWRKNYGSCTRASLRALVRKRDLRDSRAAPTPRVARAARTRAADFGLQVPQSLYEFPDFPAPKGKYQRFPKGEEVQDYIEKYADTNNLREITKFNTGIQKVSSNADGTSWTLNSETKGGESQTEKFDFVCVCTGMYGWPPHIPLARGADKFKGEILHSCTFTDKQVAAGKDVVVIGGGKSAVDNAVAAAKTGKSSTLLFRTPVSSLHHPPPPPFAVPSDH